MSWIVGLLAGFFGKLISSAGQAITLETIKFLAWRALMIFFVFVALPVVLYNVFLGIFVDVVNLALGYLDTSLTSAFVVNLSGLGAYIAQQIRLLEAFAVFLVFLNIRFIMRFLPFIK